ncbi:MAG: hypothetical protein ACE37E_10070 [Hyphomicrobiales bacterium]
MTLAVQSVGLPDAHAGPSRLTYRLAMLGLLGVFLGSLAAFAARPAEGASFAIIVPPHTAPAGLMRTVAQADGVLVRQSRYPWLAITAPRGDQSASQFRAALSDAGAIFLLHPALLAGCFNQSFSATNARSTQ